MELIKKPLKIRNMELANRLVMAPMATSKANNGEVTQKLLDYYDEKTKGGYLGLIITEHQYIRLDGRADPGQISIAEDKDIEGLKRLVKIIHDNGSKVLAQISHAGSAAKMHENGFVPISASAIVHPRLIAKNGMIPQAMSEDEIDEMISLFVKAANRAKTAGFDGVQLHSAHGYLLNQFYSPLTNKRSDQYGGSVDQRVLIHVKMIKAIREAVGDDHVIAMRLGACDYIENGSTINDGVVAAKAFVEAGLDLIDISGGFNGYDKAQAEPGYFSDASFAIKQVVDIPVMLAGGITKKMDIDRLLKEDKADLISVGRAILKDSDWAKKIMTIDR